MSAKSIVKTAIIAVLAIAVVKLAAKSNLPVAKQLGTYL